MPCARRIRDAGDTRLVVGKESKPGVTRHRAFFMVIWSWSGDSPSLKNSKARFDSGGNHLSYGWVAEMAKRRVAPGEGESKTSPTTMARSSTRRTHRFSPCGHECESRTSYCDSPVVQRKDIALIQRGRWFDSSWGYLSMGSWQIGMHSPFKR